MAKRSWAMIAEPWRDELLASLQKKLARCHHGRMLVNGVPGRPHSTRRSSRVLGGLSDSMGLCRHNEASTRSWRSAAVSEEPAQELRGLDDLLPERTGILQRVV